ncbi:FAD-dependent monooxygenase [Thiomonas sp. FB-Cd]|uniref:FAD-dependent monooxygenase n=1 Tax=Thiomonas sp. FB-Cd TaxID=1158292 RepID=UPI0004DEF4A5|nr:FAD-dependent monooxygenase [Thiomonas sp. FB-Cd]
MTSRTTQAVIAGGGIVGKALALALAQGGVQVLLCGARPAAPTPAAGYGQRVYAINAASRHFLDGLRVWAQIPAERVQSVERMRIAADGAELVFTAYAQGVEALAWIAESDAIERALDLALQFERGVSSTPASLEQATRDGALWNLQLADGRHTSTGLLLGADGRASRVRDWAGIGLRSKAYGQTGVVCNLHCAASHGATAFQTFTQDGVIALLPLAAQGGQSQVSLVWSAPDALAAQLQADGAQRLAARVQEALTLLGAEHLGPLKAAGELGAWPLVLQRAHHLVGEGVALLGDAAHVVHPLAGHGLNLGLQDAQALAAVVKARASSEGVGDARVLRRYARARAEQVLALELATDGLHRLYAPGMQWLAPLRALGLAGTNHLAPLKRWLAGYASGLAVLG